MAVPSSERNVDTASGNSREISELGFALMRFHLLHSISLLDVMVKINKLLEQLPTRRLGVIREKEDDVVA